MVRSKGRVLDGTRCTLDKKDIRVCLHGHCRVRFNIVSLFLLFVTNDPHGGATNDPFGRERTNTKGLHLQLLLNSQPRQLRR